MATPHFERLSALDASFLGFEEPNARWHEGAVLVFERGPLTTPEGGLDAERIARAFAALPDRVERYRQRLAFVPLFGHPVWVDDPAFDPGYHVRHISLPRPGDERTLKRVASYLLSQPLDHSKPLWEAWIVDGLEDDRFAIVTKMHHCMVDGAAGMLVLSALLDPEPVGTTPQPRPWQPRPAPYASALVADELARRLRMPLELVKPLRSPQEALRSAARVASGIAEAVGFAWRPAPETPFNPDRIGAQRRFEWATLRLDDVKEVKNRLGGTVNDVVLAAASGALGAYLRARRTETRDLDFRVVLPVDIRSDAERLRLGNRVTMMMTRLPVGELDPRARLASIVETTQRLKASHQAAGVQWLQEFADRVGGQFFMQICRAATRLRPFNVAITNVPGPQLPLYLLGARLRGIYPLVPLFPNQALGIAVMSFDGAVHWGFNCDWDTLPDSHELVDHLGVAFEELRKVAIEE